MVYNVAGLRLDLEAVLGAMKLEKTRSKVWHRLLKLRLAIQEALDAAV